MEHLPGRVKKKLKTFYNQLFNLWYINTQSAND